MSNSSNASFSPRLSSIACLGLISALVVAPLGCSSSATGGKDGAAGSTAGAGGSTADGAAGAGGGDAASEVSSEASSEASSDVLSDATDGGQTPAQARGQYLTSVLGCVNCHSPKVGGAIDTANLFAGVDCTPDTVGNCLSTPNLTPDTAGIKSWTDQQIIDALRLGKDPEGSTADGGTDAAPADAGADGGAATAYLFANMPYYQFANLTDADAQAIAAYLRSLKAVAHVVKANAGTFATRPTAPQWTPADPTKLPTPSADASADTANGKYLATLLCVTCHTVNTSATSPLHIDETKAFQGGKTSTIAVDGGAMMFQASNLTPDATGIQTWSTDDVVTAIIYGKDQILNTLCSPMRANEAITVADATAIADYLKSLAPVANAVNACPARM
jgi:mono/diheme cytochrome c family protein